MAYLLDSDVFIRAKNDHYGFELCPGFWDWIEQANAAGAVHSIEAVYNELTVGGDDLSNWARAHKVSSCRPLRTNFQLSAPSTGGPTTRLTMNQQRSRSSPRPRTRS